MRKQKTNVGRNGRRKTCAAKAAANLGVRTAATAGLAVAVGLASCRLSEEAGEPDAPDGIALHVRNTAPVERAGELATGGIPFPQGRLFDAADLRVRGPDGAAVPVQAHPLGIRWPDGSIRWALVQFPATVAADSLASYKLSTGGGPVDVPEHPVRVTETGAGVTVDTGVLRFSLPRVGAAVGHAFLPAAVESTGLRPAAGPWLDGPVSVRWVADREHLAPDAFAGMDLHPNTLWSFGLGGVPGEYGERLYNRYAEPQAVPWHDWSEVIERDVDYTAFFSGPVDLAVEETGPLRAVVAFRSAREGSEGEIGFSGRVLAYAGQALVRVEFTIENYEEFPAVAPAPDLPRALHISNTKHIRDFSLRFRPAFRVDTVRYGGDGDAIEQPGDRPSRLLQDQADRYRIEGAVAGEGERAPGWISASAGERTLALASRFFREIYPKALAFDADRNEIVFELWPSDTPPPGYPFTPGRIRTYEFVLGFGVEGPAASAAARDELRPWADPEYAAGTGATHRFVPLADTGSFPSLAGFVERTTERFRDRQLLYGDIHFGDQPGWSRLSTASGYHGVAHEFFVYYLASGDPEHFRLAEAAAWHNLDIDQFHWGRHAGGHVKQHTRGRDHITLRPMGGIAVWNFGDVDYYFLTGKRRVLPALERTADFLLRAGGFQPGSFTNERAAGLPFKHLAYLFEAIGDEAAVEALFPGSFPAVYPRREDSVGIEKSKAYLRRLQEAAEHFVDLYERGAHRKVPFMASYAPEGLYRLWRLTGDEAARRGVALGADALYRDMIIPTGVPYYSGDEATHLVSDPHANWRPFVDEVDRPAARAYEATGDRLYLDYAKAPLEWRLVFHGIGFPYNGFNSTIPQTLWVLREAGLREADLHRLRPDIDYDEALAKAMARARRALDAPGETPRGEAETCFRLALEVSRVLTNLGRADEALEWLGQWRRHREEHADGRGLDLLEAFEAHARRAG